MSAISIKLWGLELAGSGTLGVSAVVVLVMLALAAKLVRRRE